MQVRDKYFVALQFGSACLRMFFVLTWRLHFFFHGCNMHANHIGTSFIEQAGFIEVADANDIVIIFPQVSLVSGDEPRPLSTLLNFILRGLADNSFSTWRQPKCLFRQFRPPWWTCIPNKRWAANARMLQDASESGRILAEERHTLCATKVRNFYYLRLLRSAINTMLLLLASLRAGRVTFTCCLSYQQGLHAFPFSCLHLGQIQHIWLLKCLMIRVTLTCWKKHQFSWLHDDLSTKDAMINSEAMRVRYFNDSQVLLPRCTSKLGKGKVSIAKICLLSHLWHI